MTKTPSKQPNQRFNAPLQSWDIFISYYHRNLRLGTDVQQLEKMEAHQHWRQTWDYAKLLLQENKLIVVTDPERKILFISSNLWEITGYSAEQVLHQQLNKFRNPDSSAELITMMGKAIQAKQSFETEFVAHSQTGRPFQTRLESHPVFNQQNKLVNYIIFLKAI